MKQLTVFEMEEISGGYTWDFPLLQQLLLHWLATLLKQLLSVPLVGLFVPLLVPQLVVSREGQMAGF